MNPHLEIPPAAPPAQAHWAEVRVGDSVTRYERSGAGRPVLVLHDPAGARAIWPGVLGLLATQVRVLVPGNIGDGGTFVDWLEHFREAIGAERLTVVAAGRHALPALQFTLLEPECVERLVLIVGGSSEEVSIRGAVTPAGGEPRVPLLVLRQDQEEAAAGKALLAFLTQPGASMG